MLRPFNLFSRRSRSTQKALSRSSFEVLEERKLFAGSALSSIPALSSRPSASAKIYLDFDGASAQSWGSYNVTTTPAYDQDGDPTTFSSGELASINEIWQRVSEKFSPSTSTSPRSTPVTSTT